MKHSVSGSATLRVDTGEPRTCYARWRDSLLVDEAVLLVDFPLHAHWLDDAAPVALTAIYCVRGANLSIAVTDQTLVANDELAPGAQYLCWVATHSLVSVDPLTPLGLAPEHIAKPWGREIWYTGVERRGVCHFVNGAARTPIPWLQAVLPDDAAGVPGEPLVLLKILDPSPQPVVGDLYFELHESKREVYVVTRVNQQAWPDGVGYIRYGFDPLQLARYSSEDDFRADYLDAVLAYEARRRALDAMAYQGEKPDAADLAAEQQLRENMEAFTAMRPLSVGDVLQVPLLLPHALQHGVRVVEFQTPTYERKIVSFAQQVLTQDHWDTREAVALMRLLPPPEQPPGDSLRTDGVLVEQIVDFPDFEVERVTIASGVHWQLEAASTYRLLIILCGELTFAGTEYVPEQAMLLPRQWQGKVLASQAAPSLVFLLARPNC